MNIAELEYRLLFAMVVAGKSEKFATVAMARYLDPDRGGHQRPPFEAVIWDAQHGRLRKRLMVARTGNYNKLVAGFSQVVFASLDLATCTPEQLEAIHGIGPKTSRFFILWTRPGARHAALDTHVLKWLRYTGHMAPRSTPPKSKYAYYEGLFLAQAVVRKMTPRELDSAIWDWCSTYPERARADIWPARLQR